MFQMSQLLHPLHSFWVEVAQHRGDCYLSEVSVLNLNFSIWRAHDFWPSPHEYTGVLSLGGMWIESSCSGSSPEDAQELWSNVGSALQKYLDKWMRHSSDWAPGSCLEDAEFNYHVATLKSKGELTSLCYPVRFCCIIFAFPSPLGIQLSTCSRLWRLSWAPGIPAYGLASSWFVFLTVAFPIRKPWHPPHPPPPSSD